MPSIEDIRDDVEDLTPNDLIVLALLHDKSYKVTRIQKLSLFVERILQGNLSSDHGAYHYGGFSDGIDESLISMKGDGAVTLDSWKNYSLTEYGNLVYKEALNESEFKDKIEAIEEVRDYFEDLSDQQLLNMSYLLYPDTTAESLIKDTVQKRTNTERIGNFSIQTNLSKEEAIALLCKDLEGHE